MLDLVIMKNIPHHLTLLVMATVTLNIPAEKIQVFLSMLVENGFNKPGNFLKSQLQQLQQVLPKTKQDAHPYYDWDFYNNELEYE